ncbi:hypothetical protein Moror_1344 [Moniliophthora roreri MCA 2997]|uniref:F-box domain-containing protein n=1 Tax=Moniliophthora roreri (strain MCA 2997) TaxID=1381753 RepID=V2W7W7_MONRO|nr:hypothetical protein Moror_1344 [Moniliophthora roreri MCA 2997]
MQRAPLAPALPYDVLQHVVEALQNDPTALASCCLVNKEINQVASATLYRRLDFQLGSYMGAGHYSRRATLEGPTIASPSQALGSAWTFIDTQLESDLVLRAFELFDNLNSVTFNVTTWWGTEESHEVNPECFAKALQILHDPRRTQGLRELMLNSEVCERTDIKPFFQANLRKLVLIGVDDTGLDLIGQCRGLTELQIRGVLYTYGSDRTRTTESLEQVLCCLHNLRSLTLGRLLSSSDEYLFEMLSQLPQLEDLCLEYTFPWRRWGTRGPRDLPVAFVPLCTLKSFTLRYKELNENATHLQTTDVCKWIKHVISLSPLERLSFYPFYQPRTRNPRPKQSWDVLVNHLADKHARTLRSLDLRAGFVRKRAIQRLLQKCTKLEDLDVATSRGALTTFVRHAHNVPRLYKGRFELRTQRRDRRERDRVMEIQEASQILNAAPSLRRLIVNDDEFLGSWVLDDESGQLSYAVEKINQ